VIDRAAEQAAIDAHIAARGVTHLPEADPVARAIELWRAEKLPDRPRGMRKTVADRVKRAKRRKEVMQHTVDAITGPLHNATAPAMIAAGADPPIASLAYALWEMEGRLHGHDLRHWLTAEAIVTATSDG
jgi:Protein of unknown function (DUF2934)